MKSGQLPLSQSAALDHTVVVHPGCLDFSAEDMGTWLQRRAEVRQEEILVSIHLSSHCMTDGYFQRMPYHTNSQDQFIYMFSGNILAIYI